MSQQVITATLEQSRRPVGKSTAWALVARLKMSGLMQTAHHALMVLGLSALATLALMFVRPDITDHLKALSPFNRTQLAQEPATVSPDMASLMDTPSKPFTKTKANEKITVNQVVFHGIDGKYADATDEQRIVASWISKRYRVAGDATLMLVHNAYQIADELKLDPLLILSVAAIESSFNPFAESAVGAQGLMQVMSKLHHEKFQSLGGVKAALNPVANMKVGALILKDYVQRGGSVEAGLKMYVGAAAFNTDYGYGSKVLSEYRRLREVAGRTAPPLPATANKTEPKSTTSNGAVEQKISAPEEDKSA